MAEALTAVDPRTAVADADLIITVASLGSASQVMTPNWLAPWAVVIAVDFATYAAAELARTAALFAVDDRAQFLAYRDAGHFEGYPDPTLAMGEAIEQDPRAAGAAARDPRGHILVTHLGVGLADVLFAEAVRVTAGKKGIGLLLPQ
ncbi:MAG: hypothetical protein H0V12_11645 [Chloroflexi bacterium]|nr:hypothetical protein [Chloroflexota bacterium]